MAQKCGQCGSAETQTELDGYRCLRCLAVTTYRGGLRKAVK